jgi:uncharacterized protein YecE (DUF72 family)
MIRVGIGGWTFEPWRGTFFPKDLPKTQELSYASRQLTALEINATFYRTQKPSTFRKWAAETPEDFVFSVKAPQYATNRKVLAEAGPMIEVFLKSGLTELGPKLGPLFWQLAPTKKFDREDYGAFLKLLPKELKGLPLRHAIEAKHPSFATPEAVALAQQNSVAIVMVDSEKNPLIPDLTADFSYLRLQNTSEDVPTGYPPAEVKAWSKRLKSLAAGVVPGDLQAIADSGAKTTRAAKADRDVFAYVISGAKVRAPIAAIALLKELAG